MLADYTTIFTYKTDIRYMIGWRYNSFL